MKEEFLSIRNLIAGEETAALDRFHLRMSKGDCVELLGTEGSGKSQLLSLFAGKTLIQSGYVRIGGKEYGPGASLRDADMTCIGELPSLAGSLTVAENIILLSRKRKTRLLLHKKEITKRASFLLSQFALNIRADVLADTLSEEEKRAVELVRVAEQEIPFLVTGDIFKDMGQTDLQLFGHCLSLLKERGVTILMLGSGFPHFIDLDDRVEVMRSGRHARTFYKENYDRETYVNWALGTGSALMARNEIMEIPGRHREAGYAQIESLPADAVSIKADFPITKALSPDKASIKPDYPITETSSPDETSIKADFIIAQALSPDEAFVKSDFARVKAFHPDAAFVKSSPERTEAPHSAEPGAESPPRLHVRGLSSGLLQKINLYALAGEIVGLYDMQNNSNRQLLELLAGERRIESGSILMDGKPYSPASFLEASRMGVDLIPFNIKNCAVVENMDIAENVLLSTLPRSSRFGFLINPRLKKFLVKEFSLAAESDFGRLKSGWELDSRERMKVVLLRILLHRPRLLLVENTVNDMNLSFLKLQAEYFRKMSSEGSTILISSPNLTVLRQICDRIIVMNEL